MVETSLFEAAITHTYWQSAIAFATGRGPGAHGLGPSAERALPGDASTADGYINLGAANQRNWERLIETIGHPELGDDPRFAQNTGRMANRAALEEELNAIFAARPSAEWLALLEQGGFPAGPVLSIREMHADPQAVARAMVPTVEHPELGPVRTIGLPVKFTGTPGGVQGPAPVLGQHTAEVLAEYGITLPDMP